MEKNDAQLIADYLDGDERAFDSLVHRYLQTIHTFVYRLVGSATDAQDITQEVFVRAWKHLKTYTDRYTFKTWILAIARNASIDFLRKRKQLTFSDFEAEGDELWEATIVDHEQLLPDALAERASNKLLLERYITKLSVEMREVILLHYIEDLTFREIAEIVGRSLNTVKSRHQRAIARLRTFLDAPE